MLQSAMTLSDLQQTAEKVAFYGAALKPAPKKEALTAAYSTPLRPGR
jgi:hypothetical protein